MFRMINKSVNYSVNIRENRTMLESAQTQEWTKMSPPNKAIKQWIVVCTYCFSEQSCWNDEQPWGGFDIGRPICLEWTKSHLIAGCNWIRQHGIKLTKDINRNPVHRKLQIYDHIVYHLKFFICLLQGFLFSSGNYIAKEAKRHLWLLKESHDYP
jgi:hypothetical protein